MTLEKFLTDGTLHHLLGGGGATLPPAVVVTQKQTPARVTGILPTKNEEKQEKKRIRKTIIEAITEKVANHQCNALQAAFAAEFMSEILTSQGLKDWKNFPAFPDSSHCEKFRSFWNERIATIDTKGNFIGNDLLKDPFPDHIQAELIIFLNIQ
jgi:hypothetical protein